MRKIVEGGEEDFLKNLNDGVDYYSKKIMSVLNEVVGQDAVLFLAAFYSIGASAIPNVFSDKDIAVAIKLLEKSETTLCEIHVPKNKEDKDHE